MGDKFVFIIESRHFNDEGKQENVHNLTPDLLKKREVDFIDIAAEKVDKKEYKKEEDPTLVKSEKAERGPLLEGWKEKKPLMTCYKLVTVEFNQWGLQGKVENFLHTVRNTLSCLTSLHFLYHSLSAICFSNSTAKFIAG